MWLVQNTVLLQFCSFSQLIHWNKVSQRGIHVIKPNPRLIWEAVEDTEDGGLWISFLSKEQGCKKGREQERKLRGSSSKYKRAVKQQLEEKKNCFLFLYIQFQVWMLTIPSENNKKKQNEINKRKIFFNVH